MKRIRTNKHRGGELEHTMHTRSEDRHRIMALLEAMPVTPLSRILRDSIRSEKATGPSSSTRRIRSEREGQDGDTGDNAEDDVDGGELDTSETVVSLSNADMQRVCALANKDRNAGQARFVPCFDYNGRIPELVIDSTATSVARLSVGEFILRPRNQRYGIRSDPSACFVSTPGGPRLARFCSVVQIPYVDLRLQDRFKDYAVVEILDALDWQDGLGLSSSTWKELGYLAARSASAIRTIVDIDDVLGPAIVLPGTRIFGLPDSIIATMIHPAGRN
ncbi:unnamed protein product [Tilletia caries]|nr:unnamed protein product [Tilletia caries]